MNSDNVMCRREALKLIDRTFYKLAGCCEHTHEWDRYVALVEQKEKGHSRLACLWCVGGHYHPDTLCFMKSEIRICGNCGQHNRIVTSDTVCCGCKSVTFSMLDPDEGTSKHFIPSCFFERGNYEVWAAKSWDGAAPIVKICGGLTLEAAKRFSWPRMEVRHA